MAVQKGSALLVKVGNAASPEVFATVAGLRDTSISINSETIDVTNKDSARVRTLLADAGIKSFSISGSGVFFPKNFRTNCKILSNIFYFHSTIITNYFQSVKFFLKKVYPVQCHVIYIGVFHHEILQHHHHLIV